MPRIYASPISFWTRLYIFAYANGITFRPHCQVPGPYHTSLFVFHSNSLEALSIFSIAWFLDAPPVSRRYLCTLPPNPSCQHPLCPSLLPLLAVLSSRHCLFVPFTPVPVLSSPGVPLLLSSTHPLNVLASPHAPSIVGPQSMNPASQTASDILVPFLHSIPRKPYG